jgi:NAD(P) transhydrogenase subunit alpha
MIVAIPKEILPDENRVAAIPATVKELVKKSMDVIVEAGAGDKSFFSDESFKEAGATIEKDTKSLYAKA